MDKFGLVQKGKKQIIFYHKWIEPKHSFEPRFTCKRKFFKFPKSFLSAITYVNVFYYFYQINTLFQNLLLYLVHKILILDRDYLTEFSTTRIISQTFKEVLHSSAIKPYQFYNSKVHKLISSSLLMRF